MSGRIDELFSPDRLRKRWGEEEEEGEKRRGEESGEAAGRHRRLFEHLKDRISQRFDPEKEELLFVMVARADELLARRFPEEEGEGKEEEGEIEAAGAAASAVHGELMKLLADIEDLVEAYGLRP